jgi:hypothetical protein
VESGGGAFHRYAGFGLTLDCEIACPELLPGDGATDVRVRVGAVPESLERPLARGVTFEADAEQVLLSFPGAARFLVHQGREITVQPASEAADDSVRAFLLGPALGAVLLQRGVLALHAAACASATGAVLLAGASGRGKSTLLAALLARGHRMLSDDLSAVTLDSAGLPIAHPAFARVRLLADSLDRLGLDRRDVRPVRPSVSKYSVPATVEFCGDPRPIRAVYVLDYRSAGEIQLLPLSGQERLAAIRSHVYSRRLAEGLRLHRLHFPLAATLASQVPVVRVSRPRGLAFVDGVVNAIVERWP